MGKPVNIYEAKAHFSALIDRAEGGEEIVIARAGKPVARLVPLARVPKRIPGRWRGQIWIADDFDAPLPPEILRSFYDDPI